MTAEYRGDPEDTPEISGRFLFTARSGNDVIIEVAPGSRILAGNSRDVLRSRIGDLQSNETGEGLTPNEVAQQNLYNFLDRTLPPAESPSGRSKWGERVIEQIKRHGPDCLATVLPFDLLSRKSLKNITRILNSGTAGIKTKTQLRTGNLYLYSMRIAEDEPFSNTALMSLMKAVVDTEPFESEE